jgi:hypothetical protein
MANAAFTIRSETEQIPPSGKRRKGWNYLVMHPLHVAKSGQSRSEPKASPHDFAAQFWPCSTGLHLAGGVREATLASMEQGRKQADWP